MEHGFPKYGVFFIQSLWWLYREIFLTDVLNVTTGEVDTLWPWPWVLESSIYISYFCIHICTFMSIYYNFCVSQYKEKCKWNECCLISILHTVHLRYFVDMLFYANTEDLCIKRYFDFWPIYKCICTRVIFICIHIKSSGDFESNSYTDLLPCLYVFYLDEDCDNYL